MVASAPQRPAPAAPFARRRPDPIQEARFCRAVLRSWGYEVDLTTGPAGAPALRVAPAERAAADRARISARLAPHRDVLVALLGREAEHAAAPVAQTATRAARFFAAGERRTVDDLMVELELDRVTARRAIRDLAARGLVARVAGGGTGLWGRPDPDAEEETPIA